jgi:hypothetical protein
MSMPDNPWAERFTPLLDADEIFRRARVTVPPLHDLGRLPDEAAYTQLESSLKQVFYPTTQGVAILQEWTGLAHAHCLLRYPSRRAFLTAVYADSPPLPDAVQPICFTGMAGLGKTQIIRAFQRIQLTDVSVTVDAHHDPFPLENLWMTEVKARNSPKQVLTTLSGIDSAGKDLVRRARHRAYRDGVAFTGIDEFQFVTQSSAANTLVTQILLSISYLGLPMVNVANFSLVHRLMQRPQEDRQRLLAKPCVLFPDPPESQDWIQTLATYKAVAPDVLAYDPVNDAKYIFLLSAGIKRLVVRLIILAYRISRRLRGHDATVDIKDIEAAYHSPIFTADRTDVEIIARQEIERRKVREDLWNPFGQPLPCLSTAGMSDSGQPNPFEKARADKVAEQALIGSLTKSEREAYASMSKGRRAKSGDVVGLPKKTPLSAEDFKKNAEQLRKRYT